jgi:membrane associated rhomboid family serine protease
MALMARFLSQPGHAKGRAVILRIVSDFRRAMDLSLVLDQEGLQHELRSVGEEQWALLIDDDIADRATSAVSAFERENQPQPVEKPVEPMARGALAGFLFCLPVMLFFLWTGPYDAGNRFAKGAADAALLIGGEWWRAITALTLHADAGHAGGNALIGGIFLALLARRLGTGFALLLAVAGGICGTALAAELVRRDFVSVGASTAVFAALGALALLPGRRALQITAAVALLGFLGTGKRADLAGHLFGFACGLGFGYLASLLPPLRNRLLQLLLGLAAFAAPAFAWLHALR